ncbi:hypothetical protein SDC9_71714 [bioreactor metagenome]|uniref:Uncharacterized protein n=1 Tax=bioreactor metagenome TaxID=1076179 RepID=A0A644YGI7_9ZZZZ
MITKFFSATFQIANVPSPAPTARNSPSGEKTMLCIEELCIGKVEDNSPFRVFQIFTSPSSEPLANVAPSGEKATVNIDFLDPAMEFSNVPLNVATIFIFPSRVPNAILCPSGESTKGFMAESPESKLLFSGYQLSIL